MKDTIDIDIEKINTIEELYWEMERQSGISFSHNLDALDEIIEEYDLAVTISSLEIFHERFGRDATEIYFGSRYDSNMSTLAETLVEIFDREGK